MKKKFIYILLFSAAMLIVSSCNGKNDNVTESTVSSSAPDSKDKTEEASLDTTDYASIIEGIQLKYPGTVVSVNKIQSAGIIKYRIELDFDSVYAADAYSEISRIPKETIEVSWSRSKTITTWTDESIKSVHMDTVFSYELYEIGKLIKIGDIEKAKVTPESPDDSLVEEEIQRFMRNHPDIIVSDKKTVEKDDLIKIAYCIKDSGTVYEKAERATVKCGQTLFDACIEDSVTGRQVGEKYSITYQLDGKYAVEEGRKAECEIEILYIYTTQEAVLCDEYVKANTEYSSVDEWRGELRKIQKKANRQNAWNGFISKLTASSEFDIDSTKLVDRASEFAFEVRFQSSLLGMTEEEYIKILSGEDTDDYISYAYSQCKKEIQEILLVKAISDKYGISVSEEELKNELDKNSITAASLKEAEKRKWEYYLLLDKVSGYIITE